MILCEAATTWPDVAMGLGILSIALVGFLVGMWMRARG